MVTASQSGAIHKQKGTINWQDVYNMLFSVKSLSITTVFYSV